MIKSRPYCSRNKDGLTSPWYHLNSPDASLSGIGLIGHDNVCRSAAAYLPVLKQSGSVQSSEMYSQKYRTRLSPSGSSLCASLKLLVLFQAVSYTSKSIQSTFLFVKRD